MGHCLELIFKNPGVSKATYFHGEGTCWCWEVNSSTRKRHNSNELNQCTNWLISFGVLEYKRTNDDVLQLIGGGRTHTSPSSTSFVIVPLMCRSHVSNIYGDFSRVLPVQQNKSGASSYDAEKMQTNRQSTYSSSEIVDGSWHSRVALAAQVGPATTIARGGAFLFPGDRSTPFEFRFVPFSEKKEKSVWKYGKTWLL